MMVMNVMRGERRHVHGFLGLYPIKGIECQVENLPDEFIRVIFVISFILDSKPKKWISRILMEN
jgi:hypothetical protein